MTGIGRDISSSDVILFLGNMNAVNKGAESLCYMSVRRLVKQ